MPKLSKKQMAEYLDRHFRYNTMNSWNLSTSYANQVKIWDFVPQDLRSKAFQILEQGEVFEDINIITRMEFDQKHNHEWQIGFNGRSGGYMVLYQGGQRNDGSIYSYPGKGLDENEDFFAWSYDDLKWRYDLVKEFDSICGKCKEIFLDYCRSYDVVEKTITVPKTIQVLEPIEA